MHHDSRELKESVRRASGEGVSPAAGTQRGHGCEGSKVSRCTLCSRSSQEAGVLSVGSAGECLPAERMKGHVAGGCGSEELALRIADLTLS